MTRFLQAESIKYYLLILISFCGSILVLVSTSLNGASVTPDSVHYISTARNLAIGNGLIAYDGRPFLLWPPLYPAILSIPAILFSIDPLISAGVINAIFFGLVVFFSGLLLFRHLKSSALIQILGSVIILLSLILLDTATHAWSEIIFIFFVQVFLYYLEVYRTKKDMMSLLVLSTSASFACLTRYIGISLIITGVVIIVFLYKSKLKSGLLPLMIFVSIASLPIGAFLLRNYQVGGSLFGSRNPSTVTVFQNLDYVFSSVRDYGYFPVKIIAGNTAFLLIIIISFIACIFKERFKETSPVILYIFFYISFLVYSSSSYAFEQINSRYVSPLYIPVTLLFLVSIEVLLEPIKKILSPRIINSLFALGLFVWLISYPLKGTKHYTRLWKSYGTGGFNSPEWNKSDLIQYVKNIQLQHGQVIYSAEGPIIYILTGIVCNNTIPNLTKEPVYIPGEDEQNKSNSPYFDYYIWFSKYSNLFKWDDLVSSTNVRKLNEFKDGAVFTIFRISP